MWIIDIVLLIAIIVLVALYVAAWKNLHSCKQTIDHQRELLELYQEDEVDYEKTIKEYKEKNDNLESENYHLTQRNVDLQLKLSKFGNTEKQQKQWLELTQKQEDRYNEITSALDEISKAYYTRVEEMEQLQASKEEVSAALNQVLKDYDNLESQIAAMTGTKKEIEDELDNLRRSHIAVLEKMKQDKPQVAWILKMSPHETRLVELLDELKGMYKELSSDLATIEWKKVWLPKIQELVGREGLDGKTGIYRIKVIGDDESKCYVGQAVNIKERWYTHIKKMIGVESKGGERLYDYRPEDMEWEVLEEVDRSKLDERERYWIDFYKGKEFGLNKK